MSSLTLDKLINRFRAISDIPLVSVFRRIALVEPTRSSALDKGFTACSQGRVFIVGAGPGDPELLTIKAVRVLQQADVVLYDYLANPEILSLLPEQTLCQFVGKRKGRHSMAQSDICTLMVSHALEGKTVVRLKGGDPGIFARSSEECCELQQRGIPFAIVPGITAASGMSAYTGIMMTDREYAQSVCFFTAHFRNPDRLPDWRHLVEASRSQTLVCYMGLTRLADIADSLIAHGMPQDMPVAVCEKATTPQQRLVTASLGNIADQVGQSELSGPALIVIGRVVGAGHQVDLSLFKQAEELRHASAG